MRFEKSKESVYYRKYKKVDSALAQIGGVAKALLMIGCVLCIPFNQLHFHRLLAGQIFNFSEERKERVKSFNKHPQNENSQTAFQQKQSQIKNQKNLKVNRPTQDIMMISKNKKDKENNEINQGDKCYKQQDIQNGKFDQMDEIQQKKDKHNEMKLSWYEYIKYYVWPWGEFRDKKDKLDFAIEKIYSHLDMLSIAHKLLELERIKQLLFDENQIQLIQFLPRPVITKQNMATSKSINPYSLKQSKTYNYAIKAKSSQVNMMMESNAFAEEDDEKKSKQAFMAIRNIFLKQKLNNIDTKIIGMLDDSFLSHIDQQAQETNQGNIIGSVFQKLNIENNQSLQGQGGTELQDQSNPDLKNIIEQNKEKRFLNLLKKQILNQQQQTQQQIEYCLPNQCSSSRLESSKEQQKTLKYQSNNIKNNDNNDYDNNGNDNDKFPEFTSQICSVDNIFNQDEPNKIEEKYLDINKLKFMKQNQIN